MNQDETHRMKPIREGHAKSGAPLNFTLGVNHNSRTVTLSRLYYMEKQWKVIHIRTRGKLTRNHGP